MSNDNRHNHTFTHRGASINSKHKKPLILAVDDDERNLLITQGFLLPLGYEVLFARDGEEALRQASTQEPDVVLLDAMMPGMDGFQVARALKAQPATSHIPIVMVTSLRDAQYRVRALEAGADDFLSTPVDKDELRARVQTLVKVKAYHDHIRHYQEELKREVEARTVELRLAAAKAAATERELATQRLLSVRADRLRALGEMAAGIAHELNQPLVGVRGLAEHLLLATKRGWNVDEKRVQDKLQGIIDQADRMTHIIQHVRTFSREAGKATLHRVSLNDVVTAALEMLEAQLQSRGIEVQRHLNSSLPDVTANPFSLEEVVLNCLTNARDAIEERPAESGDAGLPHRIVIRTRIGGQEKAGQVVLEVEDTGTGIPADILDSVFDPFFTTKGPDRGMGLGLSISKSIVESFGGSIALESKPGIGTTVRVSLPVGDAKP